MRVLHMIVHRYASKLSVNIPLLVYKYFECEPKSPIYDLYPLVFTSLCGFMYFVVNAYLLRMVKCPYPQCIQTILGSSPV